MQVNNDDLYFLYIYITIVSDSEDEAKASLNKIEGLLQSSRNDDKKSRF